MALTDTSERARRLQIEIYARMTGSEKVALAVEMAEQCKTTTLDGIRARNPALSEAEVHRAWLRLLHGDLVDSFPPVTEPEVP